jgi:hypothetical protein
MNNSFIFGLNILKITFFCSRLQLKLEYNADTLVNA